MSAQQLYNVVLVGATGATGRHLFAELIKAKEFGKIVVLGRRPASIPEDVLEVNVEEEEKTGRVVQHSVDLENISTETFGNYFEGIDVYISCLGTSRKQAGSAVFTGSEKLRSYLSSQEMFRHIDYDYNYNLAKVAKEKNVRLFLLLSSQGANESSLFLYAQVKGKIENDCKALGFPQFVVFRPGFLNRGKESRTLEKFARCFVKGLPVATLARCLRLNALQHLSGSVPESPQNYLYTNNQILQMSSSGTLV